MRRYWRFILLGLVVISADLLLLRYFNTLNWPYLWPKPLLFILLGGFVLGIWFPDLFRGISLLRFTGSGMLFIGQCYVWHSLWVFIGDRSLISLTHCIGITGTYLVMALNYLNQILPKSNIEPLPLPVDLPSVAIVIPTYGEPREILEKTVAALKQLDYPEERLFILISDDGRSEEVRQLAESYRVHYTPGPRAEAKAGNLNSALAHLEAHYPQATLILTQDADEILHPSFLRKTVGYFSDPQLAFVQTPKEAITPPGDPFGNRDRVFYDILQPGRNGSGAAFSCGSGVLWNMTALRSIGGFSTWNLVEDLTTSYFLHRAGYRSEYHNEVLSIGLSPDDIPGLLKQRGTWAADTWRLFLFQNPLIQSGLTIRQRMQYLELCLFYLASVFLMPLLMLTPLLSLATGHFLPIEGAALYPWMAISILYYIVLAQGNLSFLLRMWQYWLGHWPTYTRAFWIAVRSRRNKPRYTVTRKTHQRGFYGHLLWPQFLFIAAGSVVILLAIFRMPEINLTTRLSNIGLLLLIFYLLSGICRAAFYDVSWRDIFNAFPGHWVDSIKRTGIALLAAFVILLTRNRS
jgi:cellulose synthase (UDP-forming)